MEDIREVLKKTPPWLYRIVKETGKGINRFNMIVGGDDVLLAISGGKDSLVLALCLALRLKWLPVSYNLKALHINWKEYPMPEDLSKEIKEFFKQLNIPYESASHSMHPESFKGDFSCYLCARNRKRILFDYADKHNIKKIATGHHMDDIIETTLINMCFRGNFSTMMPVQDFFNGKLKLIRPMALVTETKVKLVSDRLNLPVYHTECPHKETNMRLKVKPIIKDLSRMDKNVREHIFNSPWNINKDYLPSDL